MGDIKIEVNFFATTYMHLEGIISLGNGLAKGCSGFLYHLMEKLSELFWSLQKEKYIKKRGTKL